MNQLHVYSPGKGITGYDRVACDFIEALGHHGVDIQWEEFSGWSPFEARLLPEQHDVLSRALAYKPRPQAGPISNLNICLAEQVKLQENARNLLLTMFECDGIPDSWIAPLQQLDRVIVPTDFNHWSFTHRSGLAPEKFSVLPIGYNPDRYNPDVKPLDLQLGQTGKSVLDFPIRFLVVCEVTERKNFWGTLQTFYQTASMIGPDKCCLLMKVGNYTRTIDLPREIRRFREQLISEGLIRNEKYYVANYQPLLPEAVHPRFIATGTHYLSTSFGEGWDLTAMQAAACGLHLFVPMHSAYQCWLQQDEVTFLPLHKKLPAAQGGATGRLYAGSNWYATNMPASIEMLVSNLLDPTMLDCKRARLVKNIARLQWSAVVSDYIDVLRL